MSGRRAAWLAVCATLLASAALAEIPGALVVLEAAPGTPGSEAWGAPPRFVLLKDGQVFVGGTSHLVTTRLEKGELQALRKRIDAARKDAEQGGLPAPSGEETAMVKVRFPEDGPGEVALDSGKLSSAPRPLAALVTELLNYDCPGLVRYAPLSYALKAQERRLVGGCRHWTFPFPIEAAVVGPMTVPAANAVGWPTGAMPASVCAGEKRFVVTLRPLLPGE